MGDSYTTLHYRLTTADHKTDMAGTQRKHWYVAQESWIQWLHLWMCDKPMKNSTGYKWLCHWSCIYFNSFSLRENLTYCNTKYENKFTHTSLLHTHNPTVHNIKPTFLHNEIQSEITACRKAEPAAHLILTAFRNSQFILTYKLLVPNQLCDHGQRI